MTTQRGHRGLNATSTNTKQLYSKCNTCHARLICTRMINALHYKALENGWMCGTLPAVFTLPHNCQDSSHSLTSATKTFANSDNWLGQVSLNPDALSKRWNLTFPRSPSHVNSPINRLAVRFVSKRAAPILFSLI